MRLRRTIGAICVLAVWYADSQAWPTRNRDVVIFSDTPAFAAQTQALTAVSNVRIKGPWHIEWHAGAKNQVRYSHFSNGVVLRVEQGTLYLIAPDSPQKGTPTVSLQLSAPVKRIDVAGPATVNMTAPVTGGTIALSGGAQVACSLVQAKRLVVSVTGASQLSLAGTVGFAQMGVVNQSILNAGDLIANAMWLYAADDARVTISVIDTLRAFTRGNAVVYYAQKPRKLITVNANSSNVWWSGSNATTHNPLDD
ncbi:MAG: hypothetical protein A3J38_02745 [Gammaproteobacteria bacterium RIFCSPHIGHO2_12_FULL_45_9]|nr:MAG: hypothetical protein A3J38_02745 [Gammaproteobacteria bacterium RIFCSPHIGHO2_12_FULL_45_9]